MTTNWKPIETAPKDNKRALYLARLGKEGNLLELDFDGSWEYWEESWEMSHINGWDWCSANGIEEPTHWAYQDEPIPMIKDSSTVFERASAAVNKAKEEGTLVIVGEPKSHNMKSIKGDDK